MQSFGYTTRRIYGQNRVETSLNIADAFPAKSPNPEFIITPANDYATSIVGAAFATTRNGTHILNHTDPNVQNPVYAWLHDRNPYQLWVLGEGTSTALANRSSLFISSGQAPHVPNTVSYPGSGCASSTDTLAPGPGQQTVAERTLLTAFRDATDIVFVDADSPVDGIAASQLAAEYNAPILPLYRDINHIKRYANLIKTLGAKERMIHFVGGKKSISEETQRFLLDTLSH